jgi:hypothetical protein
MFDFTAILALPNLEIRTVVRYKGLREKKIKKLNAEFCI